MIKKLSVKILVIASLWSLVGCEQDKLPLPTAAVKSNSFGANDTSYIELNPIWNAQNLGYQFSNPSDITMGPDGIIFVTDEGNDRVVALSRAGQILTANGLGSLTGIAHPRGVDIDSKLNLLMVNGSDTLYCWNQYLNLSEIDSVAESAVFYDSAENDTVLIRFEDLADYVLSGKPVPEFRYFIFEKDDALIQSARDIYPIYTDLENGAQYNGVAAGPFGSELVYLTESNYDKIVQVILLPSLILKSSAGQILIRYSGISAGNIATFGSGAGTVDDPYGISADEDGNVYFTQFGGNFKVQKLEANNFSPQYVLYQHEIMDLNRFISPYDVALDDVNDIFVLDTDASKVYKFDNNGTGAGQELNLGVKGLGTTEFNQARGIMVHDNIVYVVESGLNQIRRFQYSVSDSDLPDDDKKP